MISIDKADDLAEAAYQTFKFPQAFFIESSDGFEIRQSGEKAKYSRKVYYLNDEAEEQQSQTSTAHFSVDVDLTSGDVTSVYCITSAGGNLVGFFDDEAREAAYSLAGIADPHPTPAAPSI